MEIDAEVRSERYAPADPQWELIKTLNRAATRDPDCLRGVLSIAHLLRTPDEVLAQPGFREKAMAAGADWREAAPGGPGGPSRSELVSIATS
jgi:hypothetical protein